MSKSMGPQMPDDLFKALRSKVPTIILATVSPDGYPNTTPIHLVYAKDRTSLFLAMAKGHQSKANIDANGLAMVNICEKNDVNYSLKGRAITIKQEMDCNQGMAVVRLNIEDIKDDSTHSETTSGIRYKCRTEAGRQFIDCVFEELVDM